MVESTNQKNMVEQATKFDAPEDTEKRGELLVRPVGSLGLFSDVPLTDVS